MIDWFTPETWAILSYARLVFNGIFALITIGFAFLAIFVRFDTDEQGRSRAEWKRDGRAVDWLMGAMFAGIGFNAAMESVLFLWFNDFTLGYFIGNFAGRLPVYAVLIAVILGTSEKFKGLGEALLSSEAVLKQAAADAKAKAAQLGHLLSVVSHDLNSPAKGVLGAAELLADEMTDEEHKMLANEIVLSARTICERIDGLAEYNKSRRMAEREPRVSMNEKLEKLLHILDLDITQSDARITHDHLPPVSGSRVHLMQLLQNLILNSIKYQKPTVPPVIHVSAKPFGNSFIQFSVSDNGIGFEPDQAETIFDPYRSAHVTEKGVGIGLTIARNIVEAHGGKIWAEGMPNQGATFYFTLPKALI